MQAGQLCFAGSVPKGQNKGSLSKTRARITSHSSGPADAGRLTPALCKTEKFKTKKQSPIWLVQEFVKIRFCGLFFWVVISVGGFRSLKIWWLFHFVCFFWVAVFPGEFLIFQKPILVVLSNRRSALCKSGSDVLLVRCKKVKTKVQCQKQGLA